MIGIEHVFVSREAADHIESQLAAVERDRGVRILFAIESGSRGWGFPSPDSDYDVRFVYVLPRDRYLSIYAERDVIELPIVGDWDINGWDLKKALALLLKPNPVLLEWLDSPIRYRWNADAADALVELASRTDHWTACLHHYLKDAREKWPPTVAREGADTPRRGLVARNAHVGGVEKPAHSAYSPASSERAVDACHSEHC